MLDTAVLPGHATAFALGITRCNHCLVTDAGKDVERGIHFRVGMLYGDGRLDVIGHKCKGRCANAYVGRDTADRRYDERLPIETDVVEAGVDQHRRNLAGDGADHELFPVDA